ncbi:MAG: B12-binding domain-containing radical SAM protein [Dissulfurimicrobium sp.]|uniref:B12-binding domain-containing radical SAM protein n=1 Tax=Dissulfurimicrobium sp. TaxID=2022436 RepID=UPI00404A3A7E
MCKKILARGLDIRWVAISRVNYVDEDALYWLRRAGCIQISYGVESGSNEIRDLLNKNIGLEDIKRAFALTVSYGILARAYFIYGCPGETWQTIQETIELINEIKPLSTIFYILSLFPGTKLYEKFVQKNQNNR